MRDFHVHFTKDSILYPLHIVSSFCKYTYSIVLHLLSIEYIWFKSCLKVFMPQTFHNCFRTSTILSKYDTVCMSQAVTMKIRDTMVIVNDASTIFKRVWGGRILYDRTISH